jgi:hypothetical protein
MNFLAAESDVNDVPRFGTPAQRSASLLIELASQLDADVQQTSSPLISPPTTSTAITLTKAWQRSGNLLETIS